MREGLEDPQRSPSAPRPQDVPAPGEGEGGRVRGGATLRPGTVLQRVMMQLIRLSRPPEDRPVFSPLLPARPPSASLLPHPARLTDLRNHALPIHTCVPPALTCFILLSPSPHVLLHSLLSRSRVPLRPFPHGISSIYLSKSAFLSICISLSIYPGAVWLLSIRLCLCRSFSPSLTLPSPFPSSLLISLSLSTPSLPLPLI